MLILSAFFRLDQDQIVTASPSEPTVRQACITYT